MNMPARKKQSKHIVSDSSILSVKNLAKDLVVRAYFARRERERTGLRGKIKSLFSKKQKSSAHVIDIFDHIEGKVVRAGVCFGTGPGGGGKTKSKSLTVSVSENNDGSR